MSLQALVGFYQTLTPDSLSRLGVFYTEDAWFKDPFNEVRGLPAIEKIFRHMFATLQAPRFVVTEQIADANGAVLLWTFYFHGRGGEWSMRGASHLRFAADGRVCHHRDYWDTGEELFMKLPVLGWLWRGVRRLLAAR